ncbi:MAG TPA: alpha/beta hydrolase [Pirellulales bacterium]
MSLTYIVIVVLMMLLENSLLFFPSKYPEGDWHPAGIKFEDVWFNAADGVKLHGWYVPAEQPRAVVLFAHGNAGNLSDRSDLLRELHALGISTLIFDYRGYGRSEGSPNEAGIMADGRAARTALAKQAGVPESEIVLMGESLGGAVAVQLASEAPARGLVLESTFSSVPEVAAFHYPWLPVKLLMHTKLDSATAIAKYHGPLLQLHGDADTIVPYRFGKKLFDAANEPKTFVTIPGGDHNDPRTAKFHEALEQFINQLQSKPSGIEG